jgi:enoyl-CoA hydratase/carnithine racemase
MPAYTTLRLTDDGQVATLRLARPEAEQRIDRRMVDELARPLTHLEDESRASVLVIQSGRPFCSGIDWAAFASGGPPDAHDCNRWERAVSALERLPQATLVVVEGACIGAGLDLLLACDSRLATTEATIEVPEVRAGRLPSMMSFRLPKYVGLGTAKRLLLTGARWTAADAAGAGLLDRVVRPEELESARREAVAALAANDATALTMARRLLVEAYATAQEDALGNFLAAQDRCLAAARQPDAVG